MLIKLLGVRGSIPTPLRNQEYRNKLFGVLREAIRQGLDSETQIEAFLQELPPDLSHVYGGDTTCITVQATPDQDRPPYIIDCGTGLRALGDELMEGACGRGEGQLHIFFTHTHWDHIQGMPFFKPLFIPGNEIYFYSPFDNLESRLTRQQIDFYFPMPFEQTASTKHFITLKDHSPIRFEDGTAVDFFPLRHPGGSFAYRFRRESGTFIFATDCEFTGQDLERDREDFAFFLNADLLILDAQYTLDDHFSKFDWGHTSITMAINIACRWAIKNLVMTHHEPAYTDAKLFENYKSAIEHKQAMKVERPRLFMAREGMQFQIGKAGDAAQGGPGR